jgi:hypothetical protein
MTRHEREDLQRLVRQRERVQKSAAKQRSAELLADFDHQLAAEYRFDDDAVWAEATKLADVEVAKAQEIVAQRCVELGIPREFAPSLTLRWSARGYENTCGKRRAELRRAAETRIASMEAKAVVLIEHASVEAQTKLALAGLTSDGARAFIDALPSVETLMSRLSFDELAGRASPPLAQQLIANPAARAQQSRSELSLVDEHTELPEAP